MTDTSSLEPAEYLSVSSTMWSSPTWLSWQRSWALPIFLPLVHCR